MSAVEYERGMVGRSSSGRLSSGDSCGDTPGDVDVRTDAAPVTEPRSRLDDRCSRCSALSFSDSISRRNSIIIANGTHMATAQQMPTREIMMVACHTVVMTKVDIIKTEKRTRAKVHTLRSMNGTGMSVGKVRGAHFLVT